MVLAAEGDDYGGNSQERLDELRGWLNKRHQERGETLPSPSRPDYQPAPAPDISLDDREPRRYDYRHGSGRVHHARHARRHHYHGHRGGHRSARRHTHGRHYAASRHAGHKAHYRHRASSRHGSGTHARLHHGRGHKAKYAAHASHRQATRASHGHKAKARQAAYRPRGQRHAGKARHVGRYHSGHVVGARKAVRASSHRHAARSPAKARKTASRTVRHQGRRRS